MLADDGMRIDEAIKIAEIVATADSGCSQCVRDLVMQLEDAFPEFQWLFCKEGHSNAMGDDPALPRKVSVT